MVKRPIFSRFMFIYILNISFAVYISADKEKVEAKLGNATVIDISNGRGLKSDENETVIAGPILFPETHLSTLRRGLNATSNITSSNSTASNETDKIVEDKTELSPEDEDEDLPPPTVSATKASTENTSSSPSKTSGKNETLCSKAVNLLFLLDSSESVKYKHWSLILNFVKNVAQRFTLGATKLGIIRYASEAEIALPMTQFYDEDARNSAIDNIFYKTGGTRTDVALEKASELLHSVEKQTASQVLILVTDGPTNALEINRNKFVEGKDLVQGPGESLKSEGVAIFCVGIEPDSVTPEEMKTMKDEMKIIASEPKSSHIFISDGYRELQRKVDLVSKAACVVNGGWSPWSEFSPCTVTCGYGTKVRIRTCTSPKPENNGADCTGSRVENKPCDMGPCIAFVASSIKEPVASPAASSTQITPLQGSYQNFQVIQNVIEEIQKPDDRQSGCPNGYSEIPLRDDQYSASSTYSRGIGDDAIMRMHAPSNAKLNNADNAGSWCAEPSYIFQNDKTQYLQFSLDKSELISMVATQGSHEYNSWVKTYSLEYSSDEKTWLSYKNKVKLEANIDRDTIKRQTLNPAIRARYVRLIPQDWQGEGSVEPHDICLRAALYKCSDNAKKEDSKAEKAASVTKRSEISGNKVRSFLHQSEEKTFKAIKPISKRILGRLRKMAKHIIRKMKHHHGNSS